MNCSIGASHSTFHFGCRLGATWEQAHLKETDAQDATAGTPGS
jgi:hypothetical protein